MYTTDVVDRPTAVFAIFVFNIFHPGACCPVDKLNSRGTSIDELKD